MALSSWAFTIIRHKLYIWESSLQLLPLNELYRKLEWLADKSFGAPLLHLILYLFNRGENVSKKINVTVKTPYDPVNTDTEETRLRVRTIQQLFKLSKLSECRVRCSVDTKTKHSIQKQATSKGREKRKGSSNSRCRFSSFPQWFAFVFPQHT